MRDTTELHILSFEGPDPYARAGGIATRITGLARALADRELETHLWFVGNPEGDPHETQGRLTLHRWCQWLSRYHPGGVYDGEEAKRHDYATSLPPFLMETLAPRLLGGGRAVVLAEEWHTTEAVLHLDWLLRLAGLRHQVTILWNANNTFGFDRIDWARLRAAATITTVSRYMKHHMLGLGVEALVIPNGLGPESFLPPDRQAVREFQRKFADRVVLAKVARWDPDKRWLLAVDTVAALKRQGSRPLLIARGGLEAHEHEVMERARALNLDVIERSSPAPGPRGLLESVSAINGADIVVLRSHLDAQARSVLFRGADAVLANSGHEPFGLVGLEAMAVGGIACTGASGEDYAMDGRNALVLQRNDPHEFLSLFAPLQQQPALRRQLRRSGMATARQYAWPAVVRRSLLPRVEARA